MKKNSTYLVGILSLAVGLLIGFILFGAKDKIASDVDSPQEQQTVAQVWICSMHPQIRQNEFGLCPICAMDLIPANSTNNESNEFGFQMTEEAVQLAQIQTTIIGNASAGEGATLSLNGKIQADETKAASLVSHIPGRIEKLFVSYTGEQVNQGQKIATIYSPELITAQKELLEAQKIKDISPGLLVAAKNKLKYWKIDNQIIEDILATGIVRETFNIYADYSGIVSKRRVSVGDYLSTGEVLFDIQNLSNLWAIFDVYENDLSKIKVGNAIFFSTPSILNKTFKSKITFIDPIVNAQTRVAAIRAEVSNASGKLKPEMFINAKLSIAQKSTILTVPKTSLLWTGERSVVYVKNPDSEIPSFEYREIEVGEPNQAGYEVISGLEPGEEVVTNGAFVIDASAQLNNQVSMMNKNVTAKKRQQSLNLPDYTSTTPSTFKNQIAAIAMAYLTLKDALIASDYSASSIAANDVLHTSEKADMTLVKGEAHLFWMDQLKALNSHGKNITESTDIEVQRKQFDFLSQTLIKALKVFGVNDNTFYVQHCPMVNNNEGADWLSNEPKILNPYFGEKMLTCGMVQDTIDKNFSNAQMPEQSDKQSNAHNH